MNMNFKRKLPTPQEVKQMYPIDEELMEIKRKNDEDTYTSVADLLLEALKNVETEDNIE